MSKFLPLLIILVTILVYCFSYQTADVALVTLRVIINELFPAIFPFLLFTSLLISFGGADIIGYFTQAISLPLFNIGGESATLIFLGTFSGFPYTAVYGREMALRHPERVGELQRIVGTIFFPSFNFVMVSLAVAIGERRIAACLLVSLYLAGFIGLFISSAFSKEERKPWRSWRRVKEANAIRYQNINYMKALIEAIFSSIKSFIMMAGIILIFATLSRLFHLIIPENIYIYLSPLGEITTGTLGLIGSGRPYLYLLPVIFGLSSLSIIAQASNFIVGSGLSLHKFLISRAYQTLLNLLVFAIILGLVVN